MEPGPPVGKEPRAIKNGQNQQWEWNLKWSRNVHGSKAEGRDGDGHDVKNSKEKGGQDS